MVLENRQTRWKVRTPRISRPFACEADHGRTDILEVCLSFLQEEMPMEVTSLR